MPDDLAALPVSAILLVALTVGVTGAATTVLLLDDPGGQPVTAGFMVKDDTRFEIVKTSGDVLEAEPTRLYIGTPQGSVEVPAEKVPGIGASWTNGKSICIVGEGPRCLQIEGAETIHDVRVAHGDQTLYSWDGQPEIGDLDTGEGPRFTVGDAADEDDEEGEAGGDPDLRLVSLEPDESDPQEGEPVTFSATVANVGDDASTATTLRVDVDGEEHDTIDVPVLADGESTTLTSRTWSAQAGQHAASGLVDPEAATGDPDPSNNADAISIAVAGEDPGHAYEDVDNDAMFTPDTDIPIPDEEIHDGEYHVQDPWSLVIPDSVDPIEADEVNFTAGDEGHVIVETNVHSNDESLTIEAGAYIEAKDVTMNGHDEGITLDADDGPVDISKARLQAQDGDVEVTTGGDIHAQHAKIVNPDENLTLRAGGSVDLTDGNLEAAKRIAIAAGGKVSVEKASLNAEEEITIDAAGTSTVAASRAVITDTDDVAIVQPDAATIEGQANKGEVAHEAGGSEGGGGGQGKGSS